MASSRLDRARNASPFQRPSHPIDVLAPIAVELDVVATLDSDELEAEMARNCRKLAFAHGIYTLYDHLLGIDYRSRYERLRDLARRRIGLRTLLATRHFEHARRLRLDGFTTRWQARLHVEATAANRSAMDRFVEIRRSRVARRRQGISLVTVENRPWAR